MSRKKKMHCTLVTVALTDEQIETLDRMVTLRRLKLPEDTSNDRAYHIRSLLNYVRHPQMYVSPLGLGSSVSDVSWKTFMTPIAPTTKEAA